MSELVAFYQPIPWYDPEECADPVIGGTLEASKPLNPAATVKLMDVPLEPESQRDVNFQSAVNVSPALSRILLLPMTPFLVTPIARTSEPVEAFFTTTNFVMF